MMDLAAPAATAPIDPSRRRGRLTDPVMWLLVAGSAMLTLDAATPVAAVLLGVAVLTVPGIFVAPLLRPADRTQRLLVVITTSIVCWMLVAHVLLTIQWWHPRPVAAGLFVVALAARLLSPTHARQLDLARSTIELRRPALWWGIAALCLWAASLPRIDIDRIDDWGLVSVLPLSFFAALAIAVLVAVHVALDASSRGDRFALGLAPLLLIIYATLPLVSSTIRYPWAYKHVGVIRLLDETGRLHPHVDIYNSFSGFFGLGAFVRGATAVDPTSYAAWVQLCGEALVLIAVAALVKAATGSTRVAHLSVVIYLVTNWVGQNYFAPQTLGSLLSLTVLALSWQWFAGTPTRRMPLVGRGLRVLAPEAGDATTSGSTAWWRRAVIALVFLGLLMTHPLTPVATVGALIGAVVIGWLRDRRLLLMLVVVGVAWIARVITYFADRAFDLGFGGSPAGNVGGNLDYGTAPAVFVRVGEITRMFSVVVWLLAVIGAVLCTWAMRRIGLVLLAGLVPFGIPLVQSYGGEAVYRVYLYSLPLMAALIAWGIITRTPMRPRRRVAQPMLLASTVCLALTAGFMVAHFGREQLNQVDPSEVAMEDYIATHIAAPALIAQFAGNYPANATARYPAFQVNDTYTPEVAAMLGPSVTLPPSSALDSVADDLVELTDGAAYVVVSRGMVESVRSLAALPVADTEAAVRFLVANPRFVVVTRIDSTWLLEVLR